MALNQDHYSPCRRIQMTHSAMLEGDPRTLANAGLSLKKHVLLLPFMSSPILTERFVARSKVVYTHRRSDMRRRPLPCAECLHISRSEIQHYYQHSYLYKGLRHALL
jgi:hypothetical protein